MEDAQTQEDNPLGCVGWCAQYDGVDLDYTKCSCSQAEEEEST